MTPAITAMPAVSAIVRRDGRYLLVRRGHPPVNGYYAFPGGRVEPGETLADAALRELKEETGLNGARPVLFRVYDLIERSPEGVLTSHYILAAHLVEDTGAGEPVAADDAIEVGWYTADEIERLAVPESVLECVRLLEVQDRGETDTESSLAGAPS